MIKIPMGFKGPNGQLQKLFSEKSVYKATKILLNQDLIHWKYDKHLEYINAVFEIDGKLIKTSMSWPMSEPLGSCNCKSTDTCIHITALAIESKARIDQLPPFVQQLNASKNVMEAFGIWVNRQSYDPYPNMARHRLVYILRKNEEASFSLTLHKAYLSTEDKYQVKADLDTSIVYQKPLPKFITLTDRKILSLLNESGYIKTNKIELGSQLPEEVFELIVHTNRCFWRTCYHSPLTFEVSDNGVQFQSNHLSLFKKYSLSVMDNRVITKSSKKQQKNLFIQSKNKITPKLTIESHDVELGLDQLADIQIDMAKISFLQGRTEFNFADLSSGKVMPDGELLQQMAIYNHQVEKLDSIQSHYEHLIIKDFHINDRYLNKDFISYAPLLRGLQLDGWEIQIHSNYRLNQVKAKDWYAEIKQNKTDKNNWFDLELGIKIDGQEINLLPYLVKSIQSGQLNSDANDEDLSIKLPNGNSVGIDHKSIQQILSTLTELYDSKSLNKKDNLSLSNSQMIRINQLQQAMESKELQKEGEQEVPILKWHGDLSLKQKADQIAQNINIQETRLPQNLKAKLRDYQLKGLAWLQFLTQNHLGGILADDMGLGKTLQTLSHILTEKNENRMKHPCLIIVPTSLLSNWESEIEKFTPSLSSLLLVGTNRAKHYETIKEFDIVITSYGIMMRDVELLSQQQFHLMILDEAQAIKNSKTRKAKVACQIPSLHRLCLSGTPIENHLGELWSLFNFLMPGFLSSEKQFNEIYQTPIEKLNNEDRQLALSKRLAPFMLRRTKKQVAQELPDKTEIVQLIELNESQTNLYETIRLTMSDEIKQALEKSNNQFVIGNALLRLRQVCCHPALLNLESIETEDLESAKLDWLSTVLPNMVEEGNRILLFSSFTSMLDIIAEQLKKLRLDFLTLTGKTPAIKRGKLVEEFQQGNIPVFLISLKAGGAGLNLTAADTVIHFDPWWNPASEQQASDRAHRIGQDKNVFVYKLITKGTVEQRIQKMQEHKQALADGIFEKQDSSSHLSDSQQWQELLKPITKNN